MLVYIKKRYIVAILEKYIFFPYKHLHTPTTAILCPHYGLGDHAFLNKLDFKLPKSA